MKPSRKLTIVASLLMVAFLAGSVTLLRHLDAVRSATPLEEVLYISSPKLLKRMSLGYEGLLADVYWTRAIQYFGGHHHQGGRHYALLGAPAGNNHRSRSPSGGGLRIWCQLSGP